MKPKIVTLVEYIYGFNTSRAHKSISSNAKRAQMLLRDMNFVYPDSEDMGTGKRHNPYRHPIIQRAINITWFRSKDDVGVVFHERFSPMPISVIALALAVVMINPICLVQTWWVLTGFRLE
ncbi:hypothetical protein B0F90DRAFT_1802638 [Multifurca ochricompacta]|uniref:DUF6532 domain-containing protein n=1 Tax=Multifurca ochricompacta TaxID=376703 RepID=A0AAD4QIK1_9AGAM|nr:hypothetical protein B0F90DRAFT_1802638 [Multifurca ochricompacta]